MNPLGKGEFIRYFSLLHSSVLPSTTGTALNETLLYSAVAVSRTKGGSAAAAAGMTDP